MALGVYFTNRNFAPDRYDDAVRQLEEAGAGAPKGRSYHVAFEKDGEIIVFDIWDSQEDFEAFGPTLMPILTGLGVEIAEPVIGRVHNTIEG
jgi:hypothetical protein